MAQNETISFYIFKAKKKLPAWVCIKHILKQTAWKNTEIHWEFSLKMRISPFIYLKQKKAACLSMYQTYTQADSMKNRWTSLEILTQNETISLYIFKAKRSCLLEYVSNIYSSRQHEKPLNFIGNVSSKWYYLILYI